MLACACSVGPVAPLVILMVRSPPKLVRRSAVPRVALPAVLLVAAAISVTTDFVRVVVVAMSCPPFASVGPDGAAPAQFINRVGHGGQRQQRIGLRLRQHGRDKTADGGLDQRRADDQP